MILRSWSGPRWLAAAFLPLAASACDAPARDAKPAPAAPSRAERVEAPPPPRVVTPTLVARTPHDRAAFTQGLLVADGAFLESTGRYGESSLRRVEIATGKVLAKVTLPESFFGEGLARYHGELFQLTWQEHRCFVYDEKTLEKRREMTYAGEGWGLTNDGGDLLVLSDGTPVLRFMDPATFHVVRTVNVHDGAQSVDQLNELEWVRGRSSPTSGAPT